MNIILYEYKNYVFLHKSSYVPYLKLPMLKLANLILNEYILIYVTKNLQSAFKRLLLPTLGSPIIATCTPSLNRSPLRSSLKWLSISLHRLPIVCEAEIH